MYRNSVIVAFIVLLAGLSTAQAFCFNFGSGSKNQADFYNRPPPAVGFGSGVYNYPHSPVIPAPLYMPYYAVPRPPEFYENRTPGPIEYR